MFDWIKRINLIWAFAILLIVHGIFYYSMGTPNWLLVALSAALVETGILAALKAFLPGTQKSKR
ncbi:hypothetical protein PASE110613_14910 [Paenibacillus sediminis]|uniref:Uncharacterized protein n=1 Tax=Paenibacillus sediminis TaxID=664909 RepID=A0ABS4H650_9BACL|nr:hypothetical protein [Paenibacillus sediminis]MBP1937996.1 hypothetical protein [Paenibacillus sediminis]